MLRLDADLSPFYEAARDDPDLAWACDGAGRMLRSPTVFEDVIKTICTTNCAWSATVRMATALVSELGAEAPDGRRAFPSPEAMAEASEDFYKDVVRAGYRGPYLREVAAERRRGRPRPRDAQRPGASRRRGRRAPARAPRLRPVRDRAHDDAARPELAADPRLVDEAEVRAPERTQGIGPDDRATLPPLRRPRRPRVLALPHERLGRRAGRARSRNEAHRRAPVGQTGALPLPPTTPQVPPWLLLPGRACGPSGSPRFDSRHPAFDRCSRGGTSPSAR